jgi:hypothetical protein
MCSALFAALRVANLQLERHDRENSGGDRLLDASKETSGHA